jgi:hypothetical protein
VTPIALKKKVESSLAKWIRYKRYHRNDWTYELLAKDTGAKKVELTDYFKYGICSNIPYISLSSGFSCGKSVMVKIHTIYSPQYVGERTHIE